MTDLAGSIASRHREVNDTNAAISEFPNLQAMRERPAARKPLAYAQRKVIDAEGPVEITRPTNMFTLAHLSDVHISPLPPVAAKGLLGKRALGLLSWHLRRKRHHKMAVARAITDDIRASGANHVALTGDLINVATPGEFTQGLQWLEAFGPHDWITFVPGNHDAYVPVSWDEGLGHWAAYMTGDTQIPATAAQTRQAGAFPFIRQRRNIALIGLSTAFPAPFHQATGILGEAQLTRLAASLSELRKRGYCRVVLLHHPPLPGQARDRKALRDCADLAAVLHTEGAELVLHGHNHTEMFSRTPGPDGPVPVIGAPSASYLSADNNKVARWYLYAIRRAGGAWRINVTARRYDASKAEMITDRQFDLDAEYS